GACDPHPGGRAHIKILILGLIGYGSGMTTEPTARDEENEPNEFGFSGEPSLPEPHQVPHLAEGEGERIAVPSGDLTGAITEAIEEVSEQRRDDKN
ncbi:hypothetical protein, partial [Actinoplanes octamycinicus]